MISALLTLGTWMLALTWLDAPLAPRAAALFPALLLAPGWGFAGRLRSPDLLQRALDASWISIALMVPSVIVLRGRGGGLDDLVHLGLGWGLLGLLFDNTRPRLALGRGPALGLLALVLALGAFARQQAPTLARPLDASWYHPEADAEGHPTLPWAPLDGFGERLPLGDAEAGAATLADPEGDGGRLELGAPGRLLVVLRGPVGAALRLGQGGVFSEWTPIEADVIEVPEEGAVPRYLDRGAVALARELAAGPVEVEVRGAGGPAQLAVLPGSEAVWAAHGAGALRFVHYYQLLNIVENLRWARELLDERALTVSQPPLWSHVLALVPLGLGGDLAGANLLFLWTLGLLGLTSLRLLALVAPHAPAPAWVLPGLAAASVGKLMLEPGSTTFPDTLYAAALLGGLAALLQPSAARFALLGVCAGALRYPGVVALLMAAALLRALDGRLPRRHLLALFALTAAVALGVGALGLRAGQLEEWLFILWFETGPEHYHGDVSPAALLPRPPEFYATWLRYTGYGALAALPLAGRGARLVGGWALAYSLLLCTIDHFPSHYFLPLVAASAVAVGANAATFERPAARWGLPLLAAAGALAFLRHGFV